MGLSCKICGEVCVSDGHFYGDKAPYSEYRKKHPHKAIVASDREITPEILRIEQEKAKKKKED